MQPDSHSVTTGSQREGEGVDLKNDGHSHIDTLDMASMTFIYRRQLKWTNAKVYSSSVGRKFGIEI